MSFVCSSIAENLLLMLQIGIIEDNQFSNSIYKEFLRNFSELNVLFSCRSMEDFLQKIPQLQEEPAVVLMDQVLPRMSGLDGISLIKEYFPDTKIIMVSSLDFNDSVMESLRKGASGYVVKSPNLYEIYQAIQAVVQEGAFISPKAANLLISKIYQSNQALPQECLSRRENEFIQLIEQGLSYKEMASKLFITTFTVNQHMKKIYKKLNVNSKSELVAKLWKQKIWGEFSTAELGDQNLRSPVTMDETMYYRKIS